MFVLNPPILMIGTVGEIIRTCITSTIAIVALCMGLNGEPCKGIVPRALMCISSLLLLDGGLATDLVGVAAVIAAFAIEKLTTRKSTEVAP